MSLTTLALCFFISQICFWDHKCVFYLGKVFYHLVEVILNLFASMFLTLCPNLSYSVCLLMSHEKCPIWQVLFILKFGTFAFFFVLYCTLFEFIMVYSKCPKCHTSFFPFCLILLVSTVWKSLSCQVFHFFSYRTNSLIIVLFRLWMFVMSYQFFC